MDLIWEERPSDSPLVETIWRNESDQPGPFISMAESQFELVVTRLRGSQFITLRGPTTAATPAYTPADAEFVGIVFKPGVFMPSMPASTLMERHDLNLAEAGSGSFWLNSSAWEYPDYENADTFIRRLTRADQLASDPIVESVLLGRLVDLSSRTVRRRFLKATGLTYGALYQIERTRYAARLLKQGVSILDTVSQAGYFDQPHLTRALKRYVGLTPAQVADAGRAERLSILYKTNPTWFGYNDANNGETGPEWTIPSVGTQIGAPIIDRGVAEDSSVIHRSRG